jgi:predicted ATPase with chaperone activity
MVIPDLTRASLTSLQLPTHLCIALHACPCGYFGDPVRPCTCSPGIVTKYQKRISGPLLDRTIAHLAEALQYRPRMLEVKCEF